MQTSTPVTLWRRLAAIVYDSFLIFGVVFAATALLLPFTGGEAISAGTLWYDAYLLTVCFLFFGWCWTHGGQTLGMRAWKIKVQQADGSAVSWTQALLRFVFAMISWLALGLGFLWALWDGEKRTWHDRWSGTLLVRLSDP
jgi:uncharacterized RDD family membrane protein YckC